MATKKKPPKKTDSAILHTVWVDGVNSGTKRLLPDRPKDDDKKLLKLFKALHKAQSQALEAVEGIVAIRKTEADVAGDETKLASCDAAVAKLKEEVALLQQEIDEATGKPAATPAAEPAPAPAKPAAKKVAAKKVAAKKVAAKKTGKKKS
ncbi:hypothetical protein [Derxia lacustris]|uniref:hypothetical protein n=1 Tax=Derxia lacustris TaxID=764842 RepID=UPI000A16CC98|nr:hypothetical protein [Derxia lacustris]